MNEEGLPNPFDPNFAGGDVDSDVLSGLASEIENGPRVNEPNFPSIYPLVYHNINLEITQRYSSAVRVAYISSNSFTWCLLYQFIASFISFKLKDGKSSITQDSILSLLQLIIFPSILFYVQYYPLYKSFRDENYFAGFNIIQPLILLAMTINIIGFRGTGIIGIQYVIAAFRSKAVVCRIFGLGITFWHIINFILQIVVYIMARPLLEATSRYADTV